MTAAVVLLSALSLALGIPLGLCVRWIVATVDRERAQLKEQQMQERAMLAAQSERDAAVVKAVTAQAAADKAIAQLEKTQVALNAATHLVLEERRKRIEGMTTEQLVEGINAEIVALSEAPGTALEKP